MLENERGCAGDMRFRVTHTTRYAYSRPVSLEPHVIRLRPRCDGAQRIRRFDWRIEPSPLGTSEQLDAEGNVVLNAWFGGLTDTLSVVTAFEAEVSRANPFDFLLDPGCTRLPLSYPLYRYPSLAACCQRRSPVHPGIRELSHGVFREADGQTLAFLTSLNRRIFERTEQTVREMGDPQPPGMTWETRRGSCRDLAVLYIEACRLQGIAARFVSGYQEGAPDQAMRHLHAWAEVYLTGAGWLGFDPTLGLVVADRHVAVAASVTPPGAAPITGTFRGTNAQADMEATIELLAWSA